MLDIVLPLLVIPFQQLFCQGFAAFGDLIQGLQEVLLTQPSPPQAFPGQLQQLQSNALHPPHVSECRGHRLGLRLHAVLLLHACTAVAALQGQLQQLQSNALHPPHESSSKTRCSQLQSSALPHVSQNQDTTAWA